MLRRMVVRPRRSSHPRDNTYQVPLIIAGVMYVFDAGGVDKSVSKGQFINDGLTENEKCRIRGAPNGAQYCFVNRGHDITRKNTRNTHI